MRTEQQRQADEASLLASWRVNTARYLDNALAIAVAITPSASNMSAVLRAVAIGPDGTRWWITAPYGARATGLPYDRTHEGLRLRGYGFSRTYALCEALVQASGCQRSAHALHNLMVTL
jgi:hypothetical protein